MDIETEPASAVQTPKAVMVNSVAHYVDANNVHLVFVSLWMKDPSELTRRFPKARWMPVHRAPVVWQPGNINGGVRLVVVDAVSYHWLSGREHTLQTAFFAPDKDPHGGTLDATGVPRPRFFISSVNVVTGLPTKRPSDEDRKRFHQPINTSFEAFLESVMATGF